MADPLIFSGLGSLAQGFLAGREAKRQREADEADRAFRQQQFEFQQQEALRQAERQTQADKLAYMGLAQKFADAGQTDFANRMQREYFPELNPDIVTQKPVEQILPASTLPAMPTPTRLPTERRNIFQAEQGIADLARQGMSLPNMLTLREQTMRDYSEPSRVQDIATAPRGSAAFGQQTFRPSGSVDEITPAPDLFKAQPDRKDIQKQDDAVKEASKGVEAALRGGWLDPAQMDKYYGLKAAYEESKDIAAFMQGLKSLKYRERPASTSSGLRERADTQDYIISSLNFTRRLDQSVNETQDNIRAKDATIAAMEEKLSIIETKYKNKRIDESFYNDEKTKLETEIRKAKANVLKMERDIQKYKSDKLQTLKNVNQKQKELGLGSPYEVEDEEEIIKVDY